IIELPSYTAEEKLQIAKRHLLPRQLEEHGVKKKLVRIADSTLRRLIQDYTREAGVRYLERVLASLIRKTAREIASRSGVTGTITVTPQDLQKYLGPAKFLSEVSE